jgi:hypothetical protein
LLAELNVAVIRLAGTVAIVDLAREELPSGIQMTRENIEALRT